MAKANQDYWEISLGVPGTMLAWTLWLIQRDNSF